MVDLGFVAESNNSPVKAYISRWALSLPQAFSRHRSSTKLHSHISDTAQAQHNGGLADQHPFTHNSTKTLPISSVSSRTTTSQNCFPNVHSSVEEVANWLANLGYDDASMRSRCEEIDGEAVLSFSDQEFRDLGLKWGVAKKLAAWLRKDQIDRMGTVGPKSGEVESSLTLGAERTLYAAQQMGWNIVFVSIGLMMATMDDAVPETCGMVSVICGIAFIIASWLFHLKRLHDFSIHRQVSLVSSTVFTFGCTFFFVLAVSTELYFGAIYPCLMRTKQVEINA